MGVLIIIIITQLGKDKWWSVGSSWNLVQKWKNNMQNGDTRVLRDWARSLCWPSTLHL